MPSLMCSQPTNGSAQSKEIRNFSGEPVGVGTTYIAQVTKFLGKEFIIDMEVTTFEPPARYGERVSGAMPGDMMVTLEPDNWRNHPVCFHAET